MTPKLLYVADKDIGVSVFLDLCESPPRVALDNYDGLSEELKRILLSQVGFAPCWQLQKIGQLNFRVDLLGYPEEGVAGWRALWQGHMRELRRLGAPISGLPLSKSAFAGRPEYGCFYGVVPYGVALAAVVARHEALEYLLVPVEDPQLRHQEESCVCYGLMPAKLLVMD